MLPQPPVGAAVDESRLQRLLDQMIMNDLGGAASVAMVRMGEALGLYHTLRAKGAMTCAELAREANVNERYLREWLSHQVASNYLTYDPESERFALSPKQAMVFAEEDSPTFMMGAFDAMVGYQQNQAKVRSLGVAASNTSDIDRTIEVIMPGPLTCLIWLILGAFAIGTEGFMIAGLRPALARSLPRRRCRG
jgi:hypothetical protein